MQLLSMNLFLCSSVKQSCLYGATLAAT